MKQKQITSFETLIEQSARALSGAAEVGTGLLAINTEEAIRTDRNAFMTARTNYGNGTTELTTRRKSLRTTLADASQFGKRLRERLKETLGNRYSLQWEPVGFRGSLAIPRTTGGLLLLLTSAQGYLTANPAAQLTEWQVTAARAEDLANQLNAARAAVDSQDATVEGLLQTRNSARAQLLKRLRDLTLELRQKLGSLDSRWTKFGLNRPGAQETPDVPADLVVVLIGNTAASIRWTASARAEHYRVWKRVLGVDAEFVAAGNPADVDFTIDELPANSTIEVAVSAVNNGGESGKSTVATVTTH